MSVETRANILLVDDRPENLLALEAVLEELGENLVRAASGEEALERLAGADFAAVLLDVQMPGLDGFETAKVVRARERSRHTPIIFVSAAEDPSFSVRAAYGLGAVDFLLKPIDPEILRAKVSFFIELHRLRAAERRRNEDAARENAAWVRTVTDNAPVLIAYLDRGLRYRFANGLYEEWFGLPPGEILGRELREVVGDEVFEQRRPFIETVLAGRPVRFDGPTIHRRLGRRDTEVIYTPHVVRGEVRGFFSVIQDITDRKRSEAALKESESRYKAAVETALDCVIGMDHEGRITEFNPAAVATFGYTRAEVLGREMGEIIIPPEHRGAHRDGLRRYLATGEAHVLGRRIEMPALRKGGERFECELSITRNPGEPPTFTGFLRDVTGRKREERRQRFLADLATVTQSLTDPEHVTAATARMLAEHLGCDRCAYAEVEDESVYVITGDHTRGVPSIVGRWPVAAFGAEHHRLMLADEPYVVTDADADPRIGPGDLPAYRATGIRAVICLPLHKAGKFTAAMAVHQLTPRAWREEEIALVREVVARCWEALERARATRALTESEAKFRQLAETIPNLAWVARPDGHIFWYNRRWYEYTGTTPDEMEGWGWQKVHDPEALPKVVERWQRSLATGEPFDMTFPLRGRDGVFRPFLTRVNPFKDRDNRTVLWFGTNTDISEQKTVEAALAAKTAELRRVMETAGVGLVRVGKDLRYLSVNPAYARLAGLPAEEIVGRPMEEVLGPDGVAAIRPYVERVLRGESVEYEVAVTFRAGGRRDLHVIYNPDLGESGEVLGWVGSVTDVTDRKRAEAAVRESEARLADVFRLAPSLMVVLRGPDHVFERVSDRYHELVGRRDLVGRPVRAALPELEGQGFFEALDRVYGTGEPFVGANMPARMEYRPGEPPEERFFDFVYQPLRDPGGAVVGIIAQGIDVTDRKRAEDEVERQRRLLKAITDNASVALFIMDDRQQCVFMNPAAEAMTGFSLDELRGKALHDVIHHTRPDGRPFPLEECPIDRAFPENNREQGEEVFVHKDGHFYPVAFTASPLRSAEKVLGTVIEVQDITERKRAEEELRESEAYHRSLFEAAGVGNAEVELPTGRFVRVNRKYCELVGYTEEELLGRMTFLDITHPEDRAGYWDGIEPFMRGERAEYEVEKRYVRKDGSVVWAHVACTVFRDAAGRPTRMLGAAHDITARKRAEEVLREADRRKDQFIAMLAHELRNPLAPIRTAAQLLSMSPDEGSLKRVQEMIGRQVEHLTHIVNDLIEVSRVTRGKVELRRERLDLAQVVRVVAADEAPAFEAAGVALELDVPETPVWVDGDRTRLTQVVNNLLTNAAKFTDRGGRVTVRLRADGGEAVLCVRDTGVGIDRELLPHLFEPFRQADQSLDRSRGGLGLGLSLVKGLVELHGGTVTAQSAGPGRGSEFTVTLPAAAEPPALTEAPRGPSAGPSRRLRVLVVEDNRDAADSLRMLLELTGCDVAVAYTGPDGVRLAAEVGPDLVLCDIGLPGLSGYEVARRIKGNGHPKRPVLAALTGYGEEEDRRKAREAGFDRHFVKPVNPAVIEELLAAGA